MMPQQNRVPPDVTFHCASASTTPLTRRKHPHNLSKRSLPDRLRTPHEPSRVHHSFPNMYDFSNYLDTSLVRALQQAQHSESELSTRWKRSPPQMIETRLGRPQHGCPATERHALQCMSASDKLLPCPQVASLPNSSVLQTDKKLSCRTLTPHRGEQPLHNMSHVKVSGEKDFYPTEAAIDQTLGHVDGKVVQKDDTYQNIHLKPPPGGKLMLSSIDNSVQSNGLSNHVSPANVRLKHDGISRHCDNNENKSSECTFSGHNDSTAPEQIAVQSINDENL